MGKVKLSIHILYLNDRYGELKHAHFVPECMLDTWESPAVNWHPGVQVITYTTDFD